MKAAAPDVVDEIQIYLFFMQDPLINEATF